MSWIEFITQCLAAIVALMCYSKYKHKPIRLVALILWLTVITEAGARLSNALDYENNHWIYNCYAIIFYGLFYKMVYDHIQNPFRKKIVAIVSIVMLVVIGFRALTTPFLTVFMSYIFNLATVVMIINLMYYAIDLLKRNDRFELKRNLEIFVFGAYLLFAVSFIPLSPIVFGLLDESLSIKPPTIEMLGFIQGIIVIIMNLILIYGFLWAKTEQH